MPDARAGQLRTNEELKEGIKMFQLYAGIPMTGVVDDKTMEMMEMPRCGMPDFGRSDRTKRRRRYAVQGTVWEKKVSSAYWNAVMGLRWCSGQTTRLSPLRFRVGSPVRFILMWTRTQSSCEKSIVNTLPKVVGFLRVLRFSSHGKLTGWVRFEGH